MNDLIIPVFSNCSIAQLSWDETIPISTMRIACLKVPPVNITLSTRIFHLRSKLATCPPMYIYVGIFWFGNKMEHI